MNDDEGAVNDAANKLLTDAFEEMVRMQPDIGLDSAILRFEKSECESLEQFARDRGRTAQGYRGVYQRYFQHVSSESDDGIRPLLEGRHIKLIG